MHEDYRNKITRPEDEIAQQMQEYQRKKAVEEEQAKLWSENKKNRIIEEDHIYKEKAIKQAKEDQQNLIERIQISFEKLNSVAEKVAKKGWTIPFNFTMSAMFFLSEKDNLDPLFVEYYTEDDNKHFKELVKKNIESKYLESMEEIYCQCVDAYNRGHFLLTIPSLLVVLEGLLARFLENKKSVYMIQLCKTEIQKLQIGSKHTVREAAWASILSFIQELYRSEPFDENEPEFINRHWILHGRTHVKWDISDSLRLFNAIDTVIHLLALENRNNIE